MGGKWCDEKYGEYSSVEDAKSACSADSNCQAVYDGGCDESQDDVYLCSLGQIYRNSDGNDLWESSCIYEKGGISYF